MTTDFRTLLLAEPQILWLTTIRSCAIGGVAPCTQYAGEQSTIVHRVDKFYWSAINCSAARVPVQSTTAYGVGVSIPLLTKFGSDLANKLYPRIQGSFVTSKAYVP